MNKGLPSNPLLRYYFAQIRRGGRAAECTGLENQQGFVALRGFKSHPLRHIEETGLIAGFFMPELPYQPFPTLPYQCKFALTEKLKWFTT